MKKGFTLVELLVVVAILGILAAVGIVSFGGFTGSAKENVVKANHSSMVKVIETELLKCSIGKEVMDLVDIKGKSRPWKCDQETGSRNYASRFEQHFEGTFLNPYNNNDKDDEAFTSEDEVAREDSSCDNQGQTSLETVNNNSIKLQTMTKKGKPCIVSIISFEWWK